MSSPTRRSLSVDALRLLAAFGVILIHLAPSTDMAEAFTQVFSLFAVPFFFVVSLYFFIQRIGALRVITLRELRLDRILVPYAIWTLVYTLLRLAKYRLRGELPSIDVLSVAFYGGSAVHLYFLPKLVYFQMLALAAILLPRSPRVRLAGLGIAVGAIAYAVAGELANCFGFGEALSEGLLYTAAAFGLIYSQRSTVGQRINLVAGFMVLLLIFTTAYLGYPLRMLGAWEGPIAGYGIAALAFNWQWRANVSPLVHTALTCSYGIYLAHFAFLEGFELVLAKTGHSLAPYTVAVKLALGCLIALGCVVFTMAARANRLAACLFLGESAVGTGARRMTPAA